MIHEIYIWDAFILNGLLWNSTKMYCCQNTFGVPITRIHVQWQWLSVSRQRSLWEKYLMACDSQRQPGVFAFVSLFCLSWFPCSCVVDHKTPGKREPSGSGYSGPLAPCSKPAPARITQREGCMLARSPGVGREPNSCFEKGCSPRLYHPLPVGHKDCILFVTQQTLIESLPCVRQALF